MKMRNIVSVSGGKDSTAMLLLAVEREIEFEAVFADTGHESQITLDYIQHLSDTIAPIKTVRADFSLKFRRKRETVANKWKKDGVSEERINHVLGLMKPTGIPFLDMCILHGRFPSTRARFCSWDLKGQPIWEQIHEPLLMDGETVVSWIGIRADESRSRKDMDVAEWAQDGLIKYRPIIAWSVEEVISMHKKHNVDMNPLYTMGAKRVGCMPCIMCSKSEFRNIAERFPEELERVKKWERLVSSTSKRGASSFFPNVEHASIDERVRWSKTSHGGRQFELQFESNEGCLSAYGLCE